MIFRHQTKTNKRVRFNNNFKKTITCVSESDMLSFCPTCGNLLVVEESSVHNRFSCRTCPYICNVTKKITSRIYPKLKVSSQATILRPTNSPLCFRKWITLWAVLLPGKTLTLQMLFARPVTTTKRTLCRSRFDRLTNL